MPSFSKRTINQQMLHILRMTGRVIACYEVPVPPTPPRVPTNPYTQDGTPPDPSTMTKYYLFGAFEQTIAEGAVAEGYVTSVTGQLMIPRMYISLLNKTTYFDPYCNGSLFQKVGAIVDDEDIFIYQTLKSISPQSGIV